MMEDPLAALRPLHMPPPVDWWPPAPGWWIVTILAAVCILLIYRFWRRKTLQRAALHELSLLAKNCDTIDQPVAQLNQLLKRYALVCWPAKQVAALSGRDWLDFLDMNGGNGKFSNGPGQLLLTAPYRKTHAEIDDLIDLARAWIAANKPHNKLDV